jgi:hypothetical protein
MQVNPSGTYQQTARTAPNTGAKPAGDRAGGAAPVEDTGAFIPTSDLTNLVALARSAPEVRAEVVQAAAARLAAGELSTPEAAADTAKAFLADRE